MTLTQVKVTLKSIPIKQRAAVACALIGHSRIVSACWGYIYCGRCKAQVADKLGGSGYANAAECVQIGHGCGDCKKNYAAMDWRDKFMVPDPFEVKT